MSYQLFSSIVTANLLLQVKEAGRSHSTLRKRIKRDRKKTGGAPGGPRRGLFSSLTTQEGFGYRDRVALGAGLREEPRVAVMDEDRQVRRSCHL